MIHVDFTEHHEDIPPPSEPWRGPCNAEQVACEATWHDSASNFVAGTPLWNLYLLTLQGLEQEGFLALILGSEVEASNLYLSTKYEFMQGL